LRAFTLADLNVLACSFDLLLVDLRAHVVLFIDAGDNLHGLRATHELVGKLVVDTLLHDHATGSGAALSGSTEASPERSVDSKIDVRVVEHDDGILASHLERAGLEVSGCGLADDASHFA